MNNQPVDPETTSAICQIGKYIIDRSAQSFFFLASLAGLANTRGFFYVNTGGFGLLQYVPSDQSITYSPYGVDRSVIRRHACNIWFGNEQLDARTDRWVIDIFNQESEEKLVVLFDDLTKRCEGQIEFHLQFQRGPIRPEKLLSDYGLGIRK